MSKAKHALMLTQNRGSCMETPVAQAHAHGRNLADASGGFSNVFKVLGGGHDSAVPTRHCRANK
jgi:hypothetical protein